jgi:Na+:H+ antiporter, NhaA family
VALAVTPPSDPIDQRGPVGSPPLDPPGAWAPARRLVRRARAPVERFLAIEASSGILLLGVACVALLWANSPWAGAYEHLWHTRLGVSFGSWVFERDLHFWINDALMTVFFFVVGLEIRREIHHGELSELRRAALPLVAALGGMIAPAIIYTAFNFGLPAQVGWGVPMATDIAFAVGALALLGKRVPPALRILLLALAVIDDVGAILVIAVFYSSNIQLIGFVVLAVALGLLLVWQLLGVRSPWAYVIPGAAVWAGMYVAGIHPTLAGVVLGLLTPVRAWYGAAHFFSRSASALLW